MSHDHIPQSPRTPEQQAERQVPYSQREGFKAYETSPDSVTEFMAVQHSDGSLSHGWMPIGEWNGLIVLYKDGVEKAARPEGLRIAARAWEAQQLAQTPEVVPTPVQQELGYQAVQAAAVNEAGLVQDGERDEPSELAQVEAAMKEVEDSVPESDRPPLWQFATALYEHEQLSALDKMSSDAKSLAYRYRDIAQQFLKLRTQLPKR